MKNPKKQYRFTTVFLVLISAALLIPWIFGAVYSTARLNNSLTEQIDRENALTLEIVAEKLSRFFSEPVLEVQILKEMGMQTAGFLPGFEFMREGGHRLQYFERLILVDAQEDVIAVWPDNPSLIGTSQSGRKYLEKLQAHPTDYFWSGTTVDYFTGKTAIDLIVPYGTGYLAGTVVLDGLQDILDDLNGNTEAVIGIVDTNGSYLAHSDSAMVSQRMKDPMIYRSLSTEEGPSGPILINHQRYRPYARNVLGTDWTIVSYYPQEKARQPADSVLRNVIMTQGVTLLIIGLILLVLGRVIAAQINKIQAFTERIAEGSYNLTEPNPMFIEMTQIISHFESMADKVQDREMEIIAQNEEIFAMNEELEYRVQERTLELEAVNSELEGFSYTVSHDLRAPLRHIAGFVELLDRQLPETADEKSRQYISVISSAAARMEQLIDDLLSFSKMGRVEMMNRRVNNNMLVKEVIQTLTPEFVHRKVHWHIHALPDARGDQEMIRLVWTNLISNALKFTGGREEAVIEIGTAAEMAFGGSEAVYYVKDNGSGFDMNYKEKLFKIFQRLHRQEEFEGSGVGLASVHRIINRHGGRIWAESVIGAGSAFYFILPGISSEE